MKTLILGLGNPLLSDDGVGIRVAEELRERLAGRGDVEVDVDYHGGLRLMERMIGYDRSIIVDAICSGERPGTVCCLQAGTIATQHSASAHDANLSTALELGRRIGARLPEPANVLLVGIEAADVRTFNERCTPPVEAAVPSAIQTVLAALDS